MRVVVAGVVGLAGRAVVIKVLTKQNQLLILSVWSGFLLRRRIYCSDPAVEKKGRTKYAEAVRGRVVLGVAGVVCLKTRLLYVTVSELSQGDRQPALRENVYETCTWQAVGCRGRGGHVVWCRFVIICRVLGDGVWCTGVYFEKTLGAVDSRQNIVVYIFRYIVSVEDVVDIQIHRRSSVPGVLFLGE